MFPSVESIKIFLKFYGLIRTNLGYKKIKKTGIIGIDRCYSSQKIVI